MICEYPYVCVWLYTSTCVCKLSTYEYVATGIAGFVSGSLNLMCASAHCCNKIFIFTPGSLKLSVVKFQAQHLSATKCFHLFTYVFAEERWI